MPDVSVRVIKDLLKFADDLKYDLGPAAHAASEEALRGHGKFVPFDILRHLCEAITARHGNEEWSTEFVRRGFATPSQHHHQALRLLAPLLMDPKTLYRALEWTSPMVFPCVKLTYRDLGPNLIELKAELDSRIVDYPLQHVIAKKSFEKFPTVIGLAESAIDMRIGLNVAVMTVRLPESRSLFSRFRRAARALFRPESLLREIREQDTLLRETYQEALAYQAEMEKLRRNLELTVEDRTADLQRKVTELVAAKAAAEESLRSKSVFLANISHELRTPLSGIVGIAELLEDGDVPPQTQKEYGQIINQSGLQLIAMIDDLLDVAKHEESGLTVCLGPTNPRAVVTEVLRLLGPAARAKGLELRERNIASLPEQFTSDAGRLRQILVNVLGNAIKFTEKGHVGVDCRVINVDGARLIEIEISDTGRGIPENQHHLLFKPFSQVDSSTTRTAGGSGLGLYLSKSLANILGGDVVLSYSNTGGSVFVTRVKDLYSKCPPETSIS